MNSMTYTKTGTKSTTMAKLDKDVFGIVVKNYELLKQTYLTYLANGRSNNAVVKTRGEVRGGGRKPWRQKGTGRARFGSIRNPIWRGGGIVFGPTGNENYSKKLSTKAIRLANRQALSIKKEAIKIITTLEAKDGKTKNIVNVLNKLQASRNVLLVVESKTSELIQATRNIPYAKLVQAQYITTFDILNADHIIITEKALMLIEQWLGSSE